MPSLRVFVSSTCYDLGVVREQIRSFVASLGHTPIMSEYMEVLYDPRKHTHESCVKEVPNADMVILVIGSRYGGRGLPVAVESIDLDSVKEKLMRKDDSTVLSEIEENLSITQLEILKAIEENIPVFTFVDSRVYSDHNLYENNKTKEFIDKIHFPSIENQKTAKYIFEFINLIRRRTENNSIQSFSKAEDIFDFLRKQWSAYFQRLLDESRKNQIEQRNIDYIKNQLEDLKVALLNTNNHNDTKKITKHIFNYRRLIDSFSRLNRDFKVYDAMLQSKSFLKFLESIQVTKIVEDLPDRSSSPSIPKIYLLLSNGKYIACRLSLRGLMRLGNDWQEFIKLDKSVKEIVIDTVSEVSGGGLADFIYRNEEMKTAHPEILESPNLMDFITLTSSGELVINE